MNKPKVLLAKSPEALPMDIKPEETLFGHTKRVLAAAQEIIALLNRADVTFPRQEFEVLALLGAIFHDLGKATNLFQGMLRKEKEYINKIHPVRHEILSALIIAKIDNPIKDWVQRGFAGYGDKSLMLLSWIAGGHHLKLHKDSPSSNTEAERLVRVQGTPRNFIFYGSHPDVQKILTLAANYAGRQVEIPGLQDVLIPQEEDDDLETHNLRVIVEDYLYDSMRLAAKLHEDEKFSLALAKAVVIAADVAGSALVAESSEQESWINQALSQVLMAKDLEGVRRDKLGDHPLREFQARVAESTAPVTLTIAGCGTGKTVAAYAWAQRRAVGRKLFFCYPTTGTASAGFEDYLLAQSNLERALLHSRARVDLERMLGTPEHDAQEENQRLEALKAWGQQVIACTVDTALGLVQNHRRGLFSFPAFALGAFVFDEIHNYDAKMFGALLRFLQAFPTVPTLLMSASLPNHRLQLLRKTLGERLGQPIRGDARLEEIPRYFLKWQPEPVECWREVQPSLQNGKKVLWVCNTVAEAIAIYDEALDMNLQVTPWLYHSRFRYKDRVKLQEQVIQQFRQPGPVLIISTQVCEMSLDISADLLVTALAPFPALIQRLGRLNRYADGNRPPGLCLIYDFTCLENRPYPRLDLDLAQKALEPLWDKPVSQSQLAQVLEEIQGAEDIKTYSAWLDGIWESDQRPLRESDPSITVILRQDLPEIRQYLQDRGLKPNAPHLAPWTIPMYFHPQFKISQRVGGYPVADEDLVEYDPLRGAKWKKKPWDII